MRREAMQRDHGFRDVAGVRTSVFDSGPRPGSATLVMVHGGDARSLSNGLDWSTIWAPDELDARLIAYDKPGQGRSYEPGMAASAATMSGLVEHLETLIAGLPDPVVLMGHSRGALPVAAVALRRPETVAGLVLVSSNTLAPSSEATPKDFYSRAYADPPDELDEPYVRREPEMNSVSATHVDHGFVEGRRAAAVESGWWPDLCHRTHMYREIEPSLRDGRKRVLTGLNESGFAMPVLQLWGADDVSAPIDLANSLFGLIARRSSATSVVFSTSAHYVYREHPELFTAHLGAFLQSISSFGP